MEELLCSAQTMLRTRLLATRIADLYFVTRARALRVNAATHTLPYLSFQCRTTWRFLIAARHTRIHRANVLNHIGWNGEFLGFRPIKRDAKRRATRAAGGANCCGVIAGC